MLCRARDRFDGSRETRLTVPWNNKPDEMHTPKNENGQHGVRNPMLPISILGTAQGAV